MDNNIKFNRRSKNDKFDIDSKSRIEGNKLLRALFLINTFAIFVLVGFLFWKNILPIKERLLVIILFLIVDIIIFFMIRDKRKIFLNIIAFILIAGSVISIAMFINITSKVDGTISKLNKDNNVAQVKENSYESFNVYISGIDTYGEIDKISRSDVNIIATVNPKTGKILLTSVPRDTYLRIPGDGDDEYDKLTHAGNYGVQTSLKTLENALDINIPYYARINFDSLIKMVDVIGGVDVDNPVAFQSNVSDNYYEKGMIHLDGVRALFFVRERYNLPNGDNDRGKNQERVIAAMIKKLASPSSIFNLDKILSVVEESVNTNFSSQNAISILNSIIEKGGNVDVKSQAVEGEGDLLPSYAMGGQNLYMMIPSEESIKENRNNIINILENRQETNAETKSE